VNACRGRPLNALVGGRADAGAGVRARLDEAVALGHTEGDAQRDERLARVLRRALGGDAIDKP
jgi:hypothetical protein